MSEYKKRITVDAPSDEVFRFVSDPEQMPRYLPTLRAVRPSKSGGIVITGSTPNQAYEGEGWFEADPRTRVMRWGSRSGGSYEGRLQVNDTETCSVVTLWLKIESEPGEDLTRRLAIEQDLADATELIKAICEGREIEAASLSVRGYAV